MIVQDIINRIFFHDTNGLIDFIHSLNLKNEIPRTLLENIIHNNIDLNDFNLNYFVENDNIQHGDMIVEYIKNNFDTIIYPRFKDIIKNKMKSTNKFFFKENLKGEKFIIKMVFRRRHDDQFFYYKYEWDGIIHEFIRELFYGQIIEHTNPNFFKAYSYLYFDDDFIITFTKTNNEIDLFKWLYEYNKPNELLHKDCFQISYQAIKIVEHLHSKGFIHNDIKLENFIINPITLQIQMIDFDATFHTSNKQKYQIHTLEYVHPEYFIKTKNKNGKNRHRLGIRDFGSDLYAISVLILELVIIYHSLDVIDKCKKKNIYFNHNRRIEEIEKEINQQIEQIQLSEYETTVVNTLKNTLQMSKHDIQHHYQEQIKNLDEFLTIICTQV